jgi:hypothetical protein
MKASTTKPSRYVRAGIRAVADGTSFDWLSAERHARQEDLPVIRALRVLATLADVHRHSHTSPTVAPVSSTDPATTAHSIGDTARMVQ